MNVFELVGTIAVKGAEAAKSAIKGFSDQGQQAENAFSKVSNGARKISDGLGKAGKAFAPVSIGAGLIGGALVKTAKDTAAYTDNIDKMSQKLGMSREAYQEWDYVMSQNGMSIDTLQAGMKTMTNSVDKTIQSGKLAGSAFERLGFSMEDLKGKSQEELFDMTVNALQGVKDKTERAALANKVFGRSGAEMAPLLNSGAGSVDELKKKAHDLGLIMGDEAVDSGVAMTDAVDTMQRSLRSMGGAIALAVMPLITQFAGYVSEHAPQITEKIKGLVDRFQSLSPTMQKVIALILPITAALSPALLMGSKIFGMISTVTGGISKLGSVLSAAKGGLAAFSGAIGGISAPIVIIIAAIAALVAAFVYLYNTNDEFRAKVQEAWAAIQELIKTAIDAIKELISAFVDLAKQIWAEWGDEITAVVSFAFDYLVEIISGVLNVIIGIVKAFTALLKGDWSGFWNALASIGQSILGIIKTVIHTTLTAIQAIFSVIWNAIKAIVSAALNAIKSVITSVFNAIKSFISSVWNGIKSVISSVLNAIKSVITNIFNGIKSFISSVWNGIKTTITNVINGIKSGIQNGLNAAKNTVSNILNAIKEKFRSIFDAAKNIVKSGIDKIKSFFNFSWKLPDIKLPHFSVSGSFSLDPPSIPHFGVEWYKKGMFDPVLMTSPTVFGMNPETGNFRAGGEAGEEIAGGSNRIMQMISAASNEGNGAVIRVLERILKQLEHIEDNLYDQIVKALQTMGIDFDERELARLVRKYA